MFEIDLPIKCPVKFPLYVDWGMSEYVKHVRNLFSKDSLVKALNNFQVLFINTVGKF